MKKEDIRDIIYMVIAIIFGILAVRFFIWLLPIIIAMIIAYCVYRSFKKNEKQNKKKNKNIKVIHDDEKDNKEKGND